MLREELEVDKSDKSQVNIWWGFKFAGCSEGLGSSVPH